MPSSGFSPVAGKDIALNWDPTAGKTVTLVLRSGSSNNLKEGSPIAGTSSSPPKWRANQSSRTQKFLRPPPNPSQALILIPQIEKIQNSGSYTWSVPSDIVRGSDYTVEIINDDDPSETNYYPYFVIDSTVTVASTTMSTYTYGAATTSPAATSAKPASSTGSASASGSSASASDSTLSTSTKSASASASASVSASASGSSSASRTASSTSSSSTSGSSTQSASGNAPTSGAAANRVAGGLALLIAAGAFFVL